jgi:hypothetical protein
MIRNILTVISLAAISGACTTPPADKIALTLSKDESYLCVADKATGFALNKTTKEWHTIDINTEDSKFILSKSKLKGYSYDIKKLEEDYPMIRCKNEFTKYGTLLCERLMQFSFDKDTLSYHKRSPSGYWSPAYKEDTSYIESGKCRPL